METHLAFHPKTKFSYFMNALIPWYASAPKFSHLRACVQVELAYFDHGGILQYAIRNLIHTKH